MNTKTPEIHFLAKTRWKVQQNSINVNLTEPEKYKLLIADQVEINSLPGDKRFKLDTLNREIFGQRQLIVHKNPQNLLIHTATYKEQIIGFKIGYAYSTTEFYSAKGCVDQKFRRLGIARKLLWRMILESKKAHFKVFLFDTFPDIYPGMYEMGVQEGFEEKFRRWNPNFNAEQVRLKKSLL